MAFAYRFMFAAAALGMVLAASSVAGENTARANDPETISRVSAELEKLTGAHTRLVWIQDAGPTACAFSEKPTVRLMGFDSRDGKGEREIAPVGSYAKPLFTADGNRIVFGNNVDNRIYVVNWDGTGMRAVIGPGTAFEDVWADPRDGLAWVYAQLSEKRGDTDARVIRRFRLDKPEVGELVWDRMPVWHFQLSGDGRTATGGTGGGNTPQGILTLPNGSFYSMAGGCWPSAAPDFSNRGWVFRGHHRGIYVSQVDTRTGKANQWPVEFEGAPDVPARGHEVCHPRWSNNVRFFSKHPEQESERLMDSESDELDAPLFYDVGPVVPPAAAAPRDVAWAGPGGNADQGGSWQAAGNWPDRRTPSIRDNVVLGSVARGARTITIDEPERIRALTLKQTTPDAENILTLNKPLELFGSASLLAAAADDARAVELDLNGQALTLCSGDLGEVKLAGVIKARGSGSVRAVAVLFGGDGYTAAPAVSFTGNGAGAAAAATMQVSELLITKVGSGYTAAPDVRLSPPDVAGGIQATAAAKINAANGTVSELWVTDPGSGYVRQPAVTIAGGEGAGAAAEATLTVGEIHVTSPGTGYTAPPEVVLAGACGAPAVAAAALQQTVLAYTDQSGGVRLANSGTLDQDVSFICFGWSAISRGGAPNRNFANTGLWTLRNGSRILSASSTGQPIWAGGGCTNSSWAATTAATSLSAASAPSPSAAMPRSSG